LCSVYKMLHIKWDLVAKIRNQLYKACLSAEDNRLLFVYVDALILLLFVMKLYLISMNIIRTFYYISPGNFSCLLYSCKFRPV